MIGNFLTQPNKDFPLDCETLDMLQTNTALCAAIGNIAGDRLILSGCEPSAGGNQRSAGLVFVRTRDCPHGEVLRWKGGDTTAGMYIKTEDVAISAMGIDYPKAYTERTLVPGVGEENFSWNDFSKPMTSAEIQQLISSLEEKLKEAELHAQTEPLGVIKMWAGAKVPENYTLCDGAALRITDYPELYAAIGTTFNTAANYNGSANTTPAGFFRLPDLRGRFIVGHSSVDDDYKAYGNTGGEKLHALSTGELPSHAHSMKDYFHSERYSEWTARSGVDSFDSKAVGCNKTDADNTYMYYYTHDTENAGGNAPHENRPPYYTLAFIIRLR